MGTTRVFRWLRKKAARGGLGMRLCNVCSLWLISSPYYNTMVMPYNCSNTLDLSTGVTATWQ